MLVLLLMFVSNVVGMAHGGCADPGATAVDVAGAQGQLKPVPDPLAQVMLSVLLAVRTHGAVDAVDSF